MRQQIKNPSYMTVNEIEAAYDGKCGYIVNAGFNFYMKLLGGVPAVVADHIFEGQSDGFYE